MKKINFIKELRSYLLLWGSQTVSALGTAMTSYALTIWVFQQEESASSLTLLTLCSFLPTIIFRFAAGAAADRWNKKSIMLLTDLAAALGTAVIFLMYSVSVLRPWHLYVINVLLSFMNAFQVPASFVATNLLVPRKHYSRVSGLQSFSGAAISILSPALGSALLSFGGMTVVLIFDLASFAIALLVLLFFIKIPEIASVKEEHREPFLKSCLVGIRYLQKHRAVLRITVFLALVNFLAKLGNDGMLSPFVLSRTGNDQQALGMVQSAVALGLLVGSLIVTLMKPAKSKTKVIFITTAFVFAGNVVQSLSGQPWVWSVAAFLSYMMAAVMNSNLMTVMREHIPSEVQGRVFSAKDTLQNCMIPLGLFLGGVLADYVFEPWMAASSPLQRIFAFCFGAEPGSGIAVMFFCVGVLGIFLSLSQYGKAIYKDLDS